jgi:hypothetical protein
MNNVIPILKFLSVLLFFLLLSSCGKKEVEVPEGIIKPETMTSIIVDLSIADGGQNVSYSAGNSRRYDIWVFYQAALERHDVTQEQFMQSLDWYADHIKLINQVYDNALTEINLKREKLNTESDN